jgi:hypothetical protein
MAWAMVTNKNFANQTEDDESFIGGRPKLPEDVEIPYCKLCNSQQSFFLQVAFPPQHAWSELSLAVFFCTSCADEDYLIPEMLTPPLYQAEVPSSYLETYQKNFRFITFETAQGVLRSDYFEKVAFRKVELIPNEDDCYNGDKLGGSPNWLLEDETPGKLDMSIEPDFLLQLESDKNYYTTADAPPQIELDLEGFPQQSSEPYYYMFNANALYLFGYKRAKDNLVYALTQI